MDFFLLIELAQNNLIGIWASELFFNLVQWKRCIRMYKLIMWICIASNQLVRAYLDSALQQQSAWGAILFDVNALQTFCRQFLWHALMLWPEEMPAKSIVSVSANDDLVPAKLVAQHLRTAKSPAVVMTHPTAAHGGIFLDNTYQNRLVASLKTLL